MGDESGGGGPDDPIGALTVLTGRLTAPRLTLPEAGRLRAELADVLERVRDAGWPASPAPIGYDFPPAAADRSLCAAG